MRYITSWKKEGSSPATSSSPTSRPPYQTIWLYSKRGGTENVHEKQQQEVEARRNELTAILAMQKNSRRSREQCSPFARHSTRPSLACVRAAGANIGCRPTVAGLSDCQWLQTAPVVCDANFYIPLLTFVHHYMLPPPHRPATLNTTKSSETSRIIHNVTFVPLSYVRPPHGEAMDSRTQFPHGNQGGSAG